MAEKEIPSERSFLRHGFDVFGDEGVVLEYHHEFHLKDQETGADDLAACHNKQTCNAHDYAVNVDHQLAEIVPSPRWRKSIFELWEEPLSVSLEHRTVEFVS